MRRDRLRAKPRPSSSQLVARILETPNLAASVQALPAPALGRLIDAVGLEDAGMLVAFATPAQLAEVFDEDLWRSDQAGGDERFDGDRFVVWLEVMMEGGDAFVAERLASLPEDLVTLALHEHLLVLDLDEWTAEMRNTDDLEVDRVEKALSNCLSEDIDRYQLVARRHDGWDVVLAAVLALDRDHHDVLARILERLCAISAEHIDREGGLHEALTGEEMLESDVAAEREDRRAELGYVTPADARAFLKLARQRMTDVPKDRDPVTRAYFRGLAKKTTHDGPTRGAPRRGVAPPSADRRALVRASTDSALARLVVEADAVSSGDLSAPALATACVEREPLVARTMRELAQIDPDAFVARSEEIAYLANVLVAGGSIDGRAYRRAEAVQIAIEACSRGLELASTKEDPVAILRQHTADGLFRLAWSSQA